MDLNELTIIVPTKNERRNVAVFLRSIPRRVRLIVVDASDDDTGEIVRRVRPCRTEIIRDPGNIASARQRGAEAARTEWLLFTDADVVFAEGYFARLSRLGLDRKWGGIVGAKASRGRYRTYFRLFNCWLRLICAATIPAASGSNMLVRRRALIEAGGFDRSLGCNEDSFLMWQVRRRGYRVPFRGELKVYEFDHRRLDRGMVLKTLHSILRCTLLFTGLFPQQLRRSDWGYWEAPQSAPTPRVPARREAG